MFVYFKITEACDYNCSYCFDKRDKRKLANVNISEDDFDMLERNLKKFGRNLNIIVTGGEPFLHPQLLKIVSLFLRNNWNIYAFTNFSLPEEIYLKFVETAGKKLVRIYISLHLEYIGNVSNIIEKIYRLKEKMSSWSDLRIICIVDNYNISTAFKIRDKFRIHGLSCRLKPRRENGKFLLDDKYMKEILGPDLESTCARSYKGQLCTAGSKYIMIDSDGDVFACFNDAVLKNIQRHWYLKDRNIPTLCVTFLRKCIYNLIGLKYFGNIYRDEIKLLNNSRRCHYRHCLCNTPQILCR